MTSTAVLGYNVDFSIYNGSAYVQVAEVTNITWPGYKRDAIEVTYMDSASQFREYIAGEYSIADMASYPWIVPHKRQGQDLDDFPNLKRWFEAVKARPGTQRAYKAGEAIRMPRPEDLTDEQRKTLFGQTSSVDRN